MVILILRVRDGCSRKLALSAYLLAIYLYLLQGDRHILGGGL